jgi:ABC-type transport system substrate-binding protein
MRRALAFAVLVTGLGTALPGSVAGGRAEPLVRNGGTFRVVSCSSVGAGCIDSIDPALAVSLGGQAIVQQPTCASLVRYPDRPPPAGYRLVPELATALPRISAGRRVYAFRIRKGPRFSTGAPVTGRDLAHSLDRILDPRVQSPFASAFTNLVGAQEVLDGKARTPFGVKATRTTITFRLIRADGAFLANLTGLCAVPSNLPADPEGVDAPIPSAGPYYVSQFVRGRRILLQPNRYYRGSRPHHVSRFDVNLKASNGTILDVIKAGKADWGPVGTNAAAPLAAGLARRYGVNKRGGQFFVHRGLFIRLFVLNTSRRLFRNNAPLRRAVNFAVDRAALSAARGRYAGTPTDHYLSPDYPGYRHIRIYPLAHPNVVRARALARGHTRGGKAVLYVPNSPPELGPSAVAQAQIVRRDLKRIGLDVVIKQFPVGVLFQKIATPGEPFDLAWIGWTGSPDPGLLDCLFNGRWIGTEGSCNYSYFNSPRFNRRLGAASRLTGRARSKAFGRLDLELTRDAAPAMAYTYDNALTLISKRTGCVVLNPWLDLAAVCLRS